VINGSGVHDDAVMRFAGSIFVYLLFCPCRCGVGNIAHSFVMVTFRHVHGLARRVILAILAILVSPLA
jgi:hypothetical protein